MKETWRWFGDYDRIALSQIAQTGAQGIVSSLHGLAYGTLWERDLIAAHKAKIAQAGFAWDVVESLPVHEDIKKGAGNLAPFFANYRQSLANLAAEGITTICYNFMPILDWTRTDLAHPLPRGGSCLRFSAAKMAGFEMHMLGRAEAEEAYSKHAVAEGAKWYHQAADDEKTELLAAIMAGLPGAVSRYDIDGLKQVLESYQGISHDDLRANLKRFLEEIIPTAAELGMVMCIHPDDPPFDILGLPRIMSNADDASWLLGAVDETANGLTFCTGSFGAGAQNDLVAMAKAFAHRTYFAHLRNVAKAPDGSFYESDHLGGDVDMVGVIAALLKAEKARGIDMPFRADHGHALLSDEGVDYQPGYSLIGRMRGLAELRGVIAALS